MLLLVIGMTVLGSLANLADFARFNAIQATHPELQGNAAWLATMHALHVGLGVESVLMIATGLLLWRHHKPITPKIAIASLWLIPIVLIGVILALSTAESQSLMKSGITVAILATATAALVWTLYLLHSKRVRNTYS